jgi:putative ABC transport system permease protein
MWKRQKVLNQKLDSEVQYHLDRLIQEKMTAGMSEQEARREAVLEFGGPEQLKEELRDIHRLPFLETTLANLHFALRLIRKSPAFSATVVLTLALGIGANSAVFSAINAILLRPLPFPRSGQLVELRQFDRAAKGLFIFGTPSRVEDWNRLNSSFQAIAGYYTSDVSDTTGFLPEKVTEALVSPRFFRVWGVAPELGRDFLPEEEHFGGPSVVIISHRLWMHRFNGDPRVIGKGLRLEQSFQTVIGVMPAGFRFLDKDVDIWNPSPTDAPYAQDRSESWYYKVVGRLKDGTTIAEARANLADVQTQLGRLYPKTDSKIGIDIEPLKDLFVADSQKSLWLLYGSVSLLLLIACINIAALLLARSAERAHEISIRYGLGASRAAIIWQLLSECFLLALMGSGLGLFLAAGGATLFRKFAAGFPRRDEIALDWHIVLYTLVCAVAATLLCGLIPAIRGTRRNISVVTRSQVSSRNPVQWVLVGTQVALAVMLLLGAGLLLRSFQQLGRVSAGFESSHVLTFRISGNWGETANYKALTQRIDRTLETIRATPGVISAATTAMLPGIPVESQTEIKLSDAPRDGKIVVQSRVVSEGYFTTMRIPVLAGQPCPATGLVAVVNLSFVKAYLGGLNPIGQRISGVQPFEIKGVVADAREQGVNQSPVPAVYWCGSAPFPTPYFLVRTQSDPMSMAETLRRKIHTLQPTRSVYNISPLEAHLSDNFAPNRLRTFLLTAFALSAVALACTGLYGTLSYFVTVRRRECGLRLALGARRGQIIASFFVKGVRVAVIGCFVGACLSVSFTKTLTSLLFGITAADWPTWATVISAVLAVSSGASLIPAVRAAAVEPMQVLRDE